MRNVTTCIVCHVTEKLQFFYILKEESCRTQVWICLDGGYLWFLAFVTFRASQQQNHAKPCKSHKLNAMGYGEQESQQDQLFFSAKGSSARSFAYKRSGELTAAVVPQLLHSVRNDRSTLRDRKQSIYAQLVRTLIACACREVSSWRGAVLQSGWVKSSN